MQAMLTVHHLDNSRSLRVLWMLEELGLAYELKQYARDPKTMLAPPELRQVHGLGKAPVLQDGTRVLAESGAILDYLADSYDSERVLSPAPLPAGSDERMAYRYWLHYAEGSAMPPLLLKLVFDRIEGNKMPFFVKPIAKMISARAKAAFIVPNIESQLDFMEAELGKSEWFAGNAFTAADIQMSFPVEAAQARGGLDAKRPRLMAYLARIHARPAYERALARGGPFKLR